MINQEWCLFSCKVASNAVTMNFYEVTVAKVPEQTNEKQYVCRQVLCQRKWSLSQGLAGWRTHRAGWPHFKFSKEPGARVWPSW